MTFLPWWLGAPALAIACVGFFVFTRRTMGVSGSVGRALDWRRARTNDELAAVFDDNPEAMQAALLEATQAEFGDDMPVEPAAPADAVPAEPSRPYRSLPWSAHLTLLGSILVGGLVTALVAGNLRAHMDLGADFSRLVASGWHVWPALAVGGVLVGFGTRLAGGCTTGHGLTGCARLQPGSLVATGIFFGCAVAVSLLLGLLGGA